MSVLRWIVPALLYLALVACGPPKKSVFPPTVTVQQLTVLPGGQWQLTIRIQNNSYSSMDFSVLEGSMQVAELMPIRLHASFKRDIPAFAGDVIQLDVLPTAAMTQTLQAVAAKGSRGSLAYRIGGSARAQPEQEDTPRDFDFSGRDWLSPVPGMPGTFR